MSESRLKTIAGMPAYNEEKYLGSLVLQAREYVDEVVVVDDGSSDQTANIAELAGASVVRHSKNMGYGSAIQSILSEAAKRNADILIILDADSQHSPHEIPSLIEAVAGGSDLVIGSREMQQNQIAPYRRFGQRVLAKLTYVASREKLSDTESGFRAYSRQAIAQLELKEKGMAISSEIVSEAAAKGLNVTEIPISVTYTEDGSTLNPLAHGLGVLHRILVMISERRPLLFFGVLGGLLILAAAVTGAGVIFSYYTSNVLATGSAMVTIMLVTIGFLSIFTGMILDVLVRRLGKK